MRRRLASCVRHDSSFFVRVTSRLKNATVQCICAVRLVVCATCSVVCSGEIASTHTGGQAAWHPTAAHFFDLLHLLLKLDHNLRIELAKLLREFANTSWFSI